MATSYNNIGLTYEKLDEYQKALDFQNKTIEIREKVLNKNHPDLAISYNNIAGTYYRRREYQKAKKYIDKAVHILVKVLPAGHPNIKTAKNTQKLINQKLRK